MIGKQDTGPNQSILKHGPKGCCQHYFKQHHKMVSDQHLVTCIVFLSSQIFLPLYFVTFVVMTVYTSIDQYVGLFLYCHYVGLILMNAHVV